MTTIEKEKIVAEALSTKEGIKIFRKAVNEALLLAYSSKTASIVQEQQNNVIEIIYLKEKQKTTAK